MKKFIDYLLEHDKRKDAKCIKSTRIHIQIAIVKTYNLPSTYIPLRSTPIESSFYYLMKGMTDDIRYDSFFAYLKCILSIHSTSH